MRLQAPLAVTKKSKFGRKERKETHKIDNHGSSNSFKQNYRPSSFNASSDRELSTTISAVIFCGI